MSKFQDNIRIIPRAAKVTAWIVSLGCATLIGILATFPPDHSQPIPMVGRILLAKRRGMRHVMWTLLAIFIPDAIGIILYFILRDAMPVTCPSCGTSVLSKFTFCPNCGTSVKPTCPHCGKAVELAWTHCAHCGSTLPGHLPRTA
jgi:hypothetical protein